MGAKEKKKFKKIILGKSNAFSFDLAQMPSPFPSFDFGSQGSLDKNMMVRAGSNKQGATRTKSGGGMANIKNTCYINAALQLLLTTPLKA